VEIALSTVKIVHLKMRGDIMANHDLFGNPIPELKAKGKVEFVHGNPNWKVEVLRRGLGDEGDETRVRALVSFTLPNGTHVVAGKVFRVLEKGLWDEPREDKK
jgi:hypothetical protein